MDIVTATKEAVATGGFISCKSWNGHAKIRPTDTSDCCLFYMEGVEIPRRGWQPKAEDLTAEDWIVSDSLE